jgi:hypothetical protein
MSLKIELKEIQRLSRVELGENMKKTILLVDAVIGSLIAIFIIVLPENLANIFGIPTVENHFYPIILGAAVIGVSIALVIEYFRKDGIAVGLGPAGAIAIDMSIAFALVLWLLFSGQNLPVKGQFILWALVVILIILSTFSLFTLKKNR